MLAALSSSSSAAAHHPAYSNDAGARSIAKEVALPRRHEYGGKPGPEVAARLSMDPKYRELYQAHKAKAVKAVLAAEEARRASRITRQV